MDRLPRIGYVTPNSWGLDTLDQVIDLGVRAENAGAASLWVSHHVLHVGFVGERLGSAPYHDPLITLALLAKATTRARLGTSVLVLPYLRPFPLAKELATIDQVSRGRLEVGVGVGGLQVEHDAVSSVPFAQRGRYSDEFIEVMKQLWTGEPSSFSGSFFSFADVAARPGGYQGRVIPLLIGGHTDAALRRVVKYGDHWHGLNVEPDQAREHKEKLFTMLAAAGRSTDGFTFQVRLHIDIDAIDVNEWSDKAAAYAQAGVDELVLAPQSGDIAKNERWIDTLVPALTS
ncbi:MAG: TIGR03619 family F420-dependent LLM class oxidoreductase [Acidimicrobiia bacterium]